MKKVLMILFFVLMFTFSGCSANHLKNPYFENKKQNTFEEVYDVFFDYIQRITTTMETYYPRPYSDREMYHEDGYITTADIFDEDIYRHEFYNYHLSDDRLYMSDSQLYYVMGQSTALSGLVNSYQYCDNIKEGKSCVETEDTDHGGFVKYGLLYYMEDENLYLDYMYTVNQSDLYHFVFYFYQDQFTLRDTMEMTLHISGVKELSYDMMSYTKLEFGNSIEEYVCHDCDLNDASAGSLEYMYTKFKEGHLPYSYETSNVETFIHLELYDTLYDDFIRGDYFDGLKGELFSSQANNGFYETEKYAKYIRNTLVVEYSSSYYKINLNEVLGWDLLMKLPDQYNQYHLQYGDAILSDQYVVGIEREHSEYAYFEIESPQTDAVLSLDIFGLDTPYNLAYFNEKFEEGTTQFEAMLIDRHFHLDYSATYERFMNAINQFRNG